MNYQIIIIVIMSIILIMGMLYIGYLLHSIKMYRYKVRELEAEKLRIHNSMLSEINSHKRELEDVRSLARKQLKLHNAEYKNIKAKNIHLENVLKKHQPRRCPHCRKYIKKSWDDYACPHCDKDMRSAPKC